MDFQKVDLRQVYFQDIQADGTVSSPKAVITVKGKVTGKAKQKRRYKQKNFSALMARWFFIWLL